MPPGLFSFLQIPSSKIKIPRKHKTQNLKLEEIFDIFEFRNLDFGFVNIRICILPPFIIFTLSYQNLERIIINIYS